MNITDKVVVITGASSGIGRATALLLAKNNAKVALVARSKAKLQRLEKMLPHSHAIAADMTNDRQIISMIKDVYAYYGRIDILINNAGQGYDAKVEKINIASYRKLFNLDVVGPLLAMQQVIPIMKSQKSGIIINISSGTALMALPNMSAYSSLKRALVGISLTAREELEKENIKVSVVYPYITQTDFEKNTIKDDEQNQDDENRVDGSRPFYAPDTAEFVAEKIYDAILSGEAEVFVHDWMNPIKK